MNKEELKQEAEEYYEDETEGTFQICEDCYWFADAVQTAYVDSAEPREKRIAELEKENAELNQKVIDLENDREIFLSDFYCDKKGTCKLTKAKEIIKNLMEFAEMDDREYEKEYKEAEQFLSEVEK